MAIFTAMAAAFSTLVTSIFAEGAISAFVVKTIARAATSFLVKKLTSRNQNQAFGVTGRLRAGEDVPREFPIGMGMTGGSIVYANDWGWESKTPNAYHTEVIALSDLPVKGLLAVMVNGAYVTLGTTAHPDFGLPVLDYSGVGGAFMWVKFYDGTQTVADPFLVGKVGSTEFPYEATRVGRGIAYAICTVRANKDLYQGFPTYRFLLDSVKLYDPSRDSSVGGSGTQRWDTPSTWGGDGDYLPVVQAYNIMRGFSYAGKWLYGFQGMTAGRLPAEGWIAQIAKCRATVATTPPEPRYRAGGILSVATETGDAIEATMSACAGRISDIGGIFKPFAGAVDTPVMAITDAVIITTEEQDHTPFKGLEEAVNFISAQYPEPDIGFVLKDAPTLSSPTYEAEDGGRRRASAIALNNVPYAKQVQRLIYIAMREARRVRGHVFTLPPDYWRLEPNDTIIYNSERHGYVDKVFRVDSVTERADCNVVVQILEVDPADYDFDHATGYKVVGHYPNITYRPPLQGLPGFNLVASTVGGLISTASRPSLNLTWDTTDLDDIDGVQWEIRLTGTTAVLLRGSTQAVEDGLITVTAGILPFTSYDARVKPIANRQTSWSAWDSGTTAAVFLGKDDLDQGDFSGNMISNGDLARGDFRTWTNVPASFLVQPRVPGSGAPALANVPAPYCLRASLDPALAQARIGKFDCKAGDSFGYSFAASAASTGGGMAAEMWLLFYFYDMHGALASLPYESILKTDSTWEIVTGTVTAPLFATECLVAVRRSAGGAGNGYMTNIEVTKQREAKATLKPKSLSRNEIATGAISDLWQQFDLGSQFGSSTLAVSVSVDLGPVPRGSIYKRGITFEARNPGYVAGTPTTHMTVTLQRRFRVLGGAFSAWESVSDFSIDKTTWDVYSSSATLAGSYDDFEYRVVFLNNSTANNAVAVLRNIYLTVINVAAGID